MKMRELYRTGLAKVKAEGLFRGTAEKLAALVVGVAETTR